jgi:DNA-binding NarL/FixJ family response regulator
MNMTAGQLLFLSVGVEPVPESTDSILIQTVRSGRDAIMELRIAKVDLLLAGPAISDMTMWELIERIRSARPHQKWVMIDSRLSPQNEIKARSLGAMFVCSEMPECSRLHELAQNLLKKSAGEKYRPAVVEMN